MELPEKWMMGVKTLEVYNTVYNITEKNKKVKMLYPEQVRIEYGIDTEFVPKIKIYMKLPVI